MLPLVLHKLERVACYGIIDGNIGCKAKRHKEHANPLPDARVLFRGKRSHAPRAQKSIKPLHKHERKQQHTDRARERRKRTEQAAPKVMLFAHQINAQKRAEQEQAFGHRRGKKECSRGQKQEFYRAQGCLPLVIERGKFIHQNRGGNRAKRGNKHCGHK